MTQDELYTVLVDAVQKVVDDPIDPTTLRDDMSLKEGIGLDSLDMIEMVWELEHRLSISIPNESLVGVETIGDVKRVVSSIVENTAAAAS